MSEIALESISFEPLPSPYTPTEPARPGSSLVAALARAQLEITNPIKNKSVAFGGRGAGWDFANLPTILEILREPLAKNGLICTQTTEQRGEKWFVVTTLEHESGETRIFTYPLITSSSDRMKDEQVFGGGYTYAKRQALKGIFGLADDEEDNDGMGDQTLGEKPAVIVQEKISGASTATSPPKAAPQAKAPPKAEPELEPWPSLEESEVPLLDQLKDLAARKKIKNTVMHGHIEKCLGVKKFAQDCNDEELAKVIAFVKLLKPRDQEPAELV